MVEVTFKKEWAEDHLGPFGAQADVKNPFEIRIMPGFVTDEQTVQQLRDCAKAVKLKRKDNDLYKFKQSKDIRSEIPPAKVAPVLNQFVDTMLGPVRRHLEQKTGLKLVDRFFDITVSCYSTGGYLLCHNDDIKDTSKHHGRALAFIYYLNQRSWAPEDGGALAIYNTDAQGEPVSVNNRIYPKPNTLIVFRTSPTSWHSVEEVLCKDDLRLSINGWFHVSKKPNANEINPADRPKSTLIEPCPFTFVRPIELDSRIEAVFKDFFSPEYLMEKTCVVIQRKFKKKSEINLTNFLKKDKFKEINAALREATKDPNNLKHVGPYNKRKYKVLKVETLPAICKDLYDAFRSELFFMLMARLTGLDLEPPSLQRGHSNNGEGEANDKNDGDEDDDDDDDEDDDDDDDSSDGGLLDSDDDDDDEDDDDDDDDDDDNDGVATKSPSKGRADRSQTSVGGDIVASSSSAGPAASSSSSSAAASAARDITEELKKTASAPRKRKRCSNPLARLEWRHLSPGDYTLIHDHGYELGEKSALDVMLHFNHEFAVNFDHGGYISYIDGDPEEEDLHDMECELLTVEPKSNCLSLVYRCSEGTARFLKHINHSHQGPAYQDLYAVFYERPDDLPRASDANDCAATSLQQKQQ